MRRQRRRGAGVAWVWVFVDAVWLWRLYGRGICGMCGCGQCRWWIGLRGLDWRVYLWRPDAGLGEIEVKHGWCVYVVGT